MVTITQLANVEIQIIMHGLDIADIIRFGGCNQLFRKIASTPFAWKHTPPMKLEAENLLFALSYSLKHMHTLASAQNSLIYNVKLEISATDVSKPYVNSMIPFFEILKEHSTRLTGLTLVQCDFYGVMMSKLSNVIQKCTRLSSLVLDHNSFNKKGSKVLGTAIQQSGIIDKLTTLHISSRIDNMDPESFDVIMDAVSHCRNLNKLKLNYNEMSTKSVLHLAKLITENESMIDLDIRSYHLGTNGLTIITEAIKTNKSIKSLKLSYFESNKDDDAWIINLTHAIETSTSLVQLQLDGIEFTQKQLQMLCKSIQRNISIVEVSFDCIEFLGESLTVLADLLKNKKNLAKLSYSNNVISSVDAAILTDAIIQRSKSKSNNLKELDLSWTCLNNADALALVKAISFHPTFVRLDLTGNHYISKQCIAELSTIISNASIIN